MSYKLADGSDPETLQGADRALYELAFNHGAQAALESFCDTLVVMADTPAMVALPTSEALRLIADAMEKAGNMPFTLGTSPERGG